MRLPSFAFGLFAASALASAASTASAADARWGLLAPNATPTAGVYFFVGDPYGTTTPCTSNTSVQGTGAYTMYPKDARHLHWSESDANRDLAVHAISSAGANVVVMSYWGPWISADCHMSFGGPMQSIAFTSYDQLFDAVGRENAAYRATAPLRILPAIEGVQYGAAATWPADQFPGDASSPSVFLVDQIVDLVNHYIVHAANPAWASRWATMFDASGNPVYALNLLHVASRSTTDPVTFARGLDGVRDAVLAKTGVRVGFTVDPWNDPTVWAPTPSNQSFASASSFLGIQAFNPEIIQGYDPQGARGSTFTIHRVDGSTETVADGYDACGDTCTDNNARIDDVVALKRQWIEAWVSTGLPVILDVSGGYDGHYFFPGSPVGIYGDNSQDGIDDRWRNGEAEMKHAYRNATVKGIVYNAWNGYIEALTAVPSYAVKTRLPTWGTAGATLVDLGTTQYDWMRAQLSIDPRLCDYQRFKNGAVDVNGHVWGAICQHWQDFGGSAGFGAPLTSQTPTPANPWRTVTNGPQKNEFAGGGTIYWSSATNAHEVHGAIGATYHAVGEDRSCLGLPTSDEQAWTTLGWLVVGRQNVFQNGEIDWSQATGETTCKCHGTASPGCAAY